MLTRCDFALAVAPFRRRWGGVLSVVALIALTIGLGTAMGSLALFLYHRPLPWPNADRLVMIGQIEQGHQGPTVDNLTYENFLEVRERVPAAEAIAAYTFRSEILRFEAQSFTARVVWATDNYFATLGLAPLTGNLSLAPIGPDAPPPAVLSEEFWNQIGDGRASPVGTTVWINDAAHVIVGILPAGTTIPAGMVNDPVHAWTPLTSQKVPKPDWRSRWYGTLALLPAGTKAEELAPLMPVLTAQLKQRFPDLMATRELRLADLKTAELGAHWKFFVLLLGVGALLAGIMVINLASLVLARMPERAAYLAVGQHLGASGKRLLRPLVLEHLLLLALGTAIAVPLALAMRHQIVGSLGPAGLRLPRFDLAAFSIATFVASLTVLVTAIAGAWAEIKRGSQGTVSLRMSARRRTLPANLALGAQTMLAGALLVTCALLDFSLRRQISANADLPLTELDRAFIILSTNPARTEAQTLQNFLSLKEAFLARPEVARVALSGYTLLSEGNFPYAMMDDHDAGPIEQSPKRVQRDWICPDYLEVAGLRIVRGRNFTAGDLKPGSNLMIVSQRAADLYWPGEDPIGRRVRVNHRWDNWAEVIGVAQDAYSPRTAQALPVVWRLWSNLPPPTGAVLLEYRPGARLSRGDMEAITRSVDPGALVRGHQPVSEFLSWEWWFAAAIAHLSRLLAAVATVVCGFGLFSLLDRRLAAARRETAIRKALGAPLPRLIRDATAGELAWAAAGLVVGAALAQLIVPSVFTLESLQITDRWGAGLLALVGLAVAAGAGSLFPALRLAALKPQTLLQEG